MCCFNKKCIFSPKFLYQYKKVSSAKRFLENHAIWLSDPLKFNDPYEGMINLIHAENDMQAHRYIQDKVEPLLRKQGVACFGTKADNVLMWAYYAEDQKGVCIEFDPSKDIIAFENVTPITYTSNLPQYSITNEGLDAHKILSSKSSVWEHENECRIIKEGYADRLLTVNPRAITGIILGSNSSHFYCDDDTNAKDLLDIFEMLKRPEYSHIRIKQVQLERDKYKLQINEVPFFVCPRGKMLEIVSMKNQFISVQSIDATPVPYYQAKVNKWEHIVLSLSPGKYHIINGKENAIEVELK